MDTPKVFISYARADLQIAKKLYNDLKTLGVKPWLDIEDLLPGQPWKIAIKRAIKESNYFIALLSNHSVSKIGFVQSELKQALEVLNEFPEGKIFLIPVRADECAPSHEKLEDLNWVDLFPSYENGLHKIKSVFDYSGDNSFKEQSWTDEHKNVVAVRFQFHDFDGNDLGFLYTTLHIEKKNDTWYSKYQDINILAKESELYFEPGIYRADIETKEFQNKSVDIGITEDNIKERMWFDITLEKKL
jgi:hypothetical protein